MSRDILGAEPAWLVESVSLQTGFLTGDMSVCLVPPSFIAYSHCLRSCEAVRLLVYHVTFNVYALYCRYEVILSIVYVRT